MVMQPVAHVTPVQLEQTAVMNFGVPTVSAPTPDYVQRPLFGGALSAFIPKRFVDVSTMRDVPDHQEVFVDSLSTDQSLIIELLKHDPNIPDDAAAQYHFSEIANANDAPVGVHSMVLATQLLSPADIPNLPPSPPVTFRALLVGRQSVSKYNETSRNLVNLYLALIRIPQVNTDILVTINEPVQISQASSSAKSFDPQTAAQAAIASPAHDILRNFLLTLQVHDWSLFSPEDPEDDDNEEMMVNPSV